MNKIKVFTTEMNHHWT